MPFTSYARHCVDVLLWRALKTVSVGFYVDLNPPSISEPSVTMGFYNNGWHGINALNKPDVTFKHARERDINISSSEDPSSNETLTNHIKAGDAIHFVHLDVDTVAQALENKAWQLNRPWIWVIERKPHHVNEIDINHSIVRLCANGYQLAYCDGVHHVLVATEHNVLLEKLTHPPNIFDDFKLGLAPEVLLSNGTSNKHINSYLKQLIDAERLAASERDTAKKLDLKNRHLRKELQKTSIELHTVYTSFFWRLTLPMRKLVTFIRNVMVGRIQPLVARLLQQIAITLHKHPTLRQATRRLLNKNPKLKYVILRMANLLPNQMDTGTVAREYPLINSVETMPIRARQIYADLNAAMLKRTEE